MKRSFALIVILGMLGPGGAWADAPDALKASLVTGAAHASLRGEGAGSLFAGRRVGGLFAPVRREGRMRGSGFGTGTGQDPSESIRRAALRDLIAQAEAGRAGYDAVQHGARIAPPGRPTTLSLSQIEEWINATPGQPHAIGRYQFIPATLRRLIGIAGLAPDERFSTDVQDKLADILLDEAGYQGFVAGQMSRVVFMNNLARIWAGLPTDTGKSHYHGYAGNRAVISWTAFADGMAEIFG